MKFELIGTQTAYFRFTVEASNLEEALKIAGEQWAHATPDDFDSEDAKWLCAEDESGELELPEERDARLISILRAAAPEGNA